MITNSSIRSIHDTLKNAIGYNKDFKVEIDENSIANLDVCIQNLKNIMQDEGKKLPVYLDIKLPSINKYDKLEWITKVINIVELSNRLAKLPNINSVQKHMFYVIKVLGIDALSRVNATEEIVSRGGGVDIGRSRTEPNYTIQTKKYGEESVISWHLGMIDPNSDFGHLVNPTNKLYKSYDDKNIYEYNSFDSSDFNFGREVGEEVRYNEKGIRALNEMLFTRRNNKKDIIEIIYENFPALAIDEDTLNKMLNGRLLEDEEEVYEAGGYSGVKIIEKIIKFKIENNYKNDSANMIDSKLEQLINKVKSEDEEKNAENVYLLSRILDTIDFSNLKFDEVLKIIETKVNVANKIPRTFGTIDEVGEKYEMLSALEKLGIKDFDKNIDILNTVEKQIMGKDFSLRSLKNLILKIKNVFSSFKFEDYDVEPETVIDSAIMFIAKDVENGNLDAKTFDDGGATSKLLKSIKQQLSDKFRDIQSEKDTSTISADEIMEFVEDKKCTKAEILEAVNSLLEFVFEKGKSKMNGNPLEEAVELATDGEMSSKGILDLRKKMMKGEFIGGGRY